MPAIAIDATPLSAVRGGYGGHAVRGIGRYLSSILRALAETQPEWAYQNLLPVRTATTNMDWWAGASTITRRSHVRAQDTGWLSSPVFDAFTAMGIAGLEAWHSTDPALPLGPPSRLRSIVTVYDLIPLADARTLAGIRRHRRLTYRLYLQRARRADAVIAISHTTADDIVRRLGVPRARIHVVYPGLEPAVGVGQPSTTQPRQAPDLLFVGVPQAHKNPLFAIDALAECRRRGLDIRLRFAGIVPARDRAALIQHAAACAVANYVLFLDHVDDEQLADLYRSSVLLALSSFEGLGLTPLEALFAGGRAICSNAAAFHEALGGAVTYVEPADSRVVADAYQATAEMPVGPPPADLVERFSPSASARASIAAYEAALA